MKKDTYKAKPNTINYIQLYDGKVLEIWTSEVGTQITFNDHEKQPLLGYEHEYAEKQKEKQEPLFEQLTHKFETFKADVSKLTTNNITFNYVDYIEKVVK